MKPTVSLRRALNDSQLLGDALPGPTWKPWRTLLIAANGEPLIDDDERALFAQLTKREHPPPARVRMFEAAVGRRGGKSSAVGTYAAYLTGLCDHRDVLARGERGVFLCVATDVTVASVVKDRCAAAFEGSPILKQMIVRQDDTTIELSNGISIECRPCSFRKLRGLTFVGACCDELAFWYQDSSYANPDVEVVSSIRPGLLTTGGPLLLVSSVYGKSGVLYDNWRKFYGSDDPGTLVAYGTSKDFNPSLPQDEIDAALAEDRPRNAAEYLSEWRADLETFVPREAVNACVARGVFERTPERRITYFGFVDPAGGFGGDSMTLAIGHKSFGGETVVIDCVREQRPPFSPEAVIQEFAAVLKSYRINKIFGDKFAGGFPPEQFRHFGIMFEQSAKAKTDLYCDLLPLINSRRVDLLDNQRLIAQLCSLERRTTRGSGRDVIDHPPNGHDDLSNAVAGCASGCLSDRASQYRRFLKSFSSDDDDSYGRPAYGRMHLRRHGMPY